MAWLGLVLASALLERNAGTPMQTCLVLRVTGHPCPTCGSTRALLALLGGEFGTAFRLNPLFTLAVPAGGLLAGLRLGFARRIRIDAGKAGRLLLVLAGLALLGANWVWVLERN